MLGDAAAVADVIDSLAASCTIDSSVRYTSTHLTRCGIVEYYVYAKENDAHGLDYSLSLLRTLAAMPVATPDIT